MSESKRVEDLVQEAFHDLMKEGELIEELQIFQEFYIELFLLCFIDHCLEVSLEDSAPFGTEGALADRQPQVVSIAFSFLKVSFYGIFKLLA